MSEEPVTDPSLGPGSTISAVPDCSRFAYTRPDSNANDAGFCVANANPVCFRNGGAWLLGAFASITTNSANGSQLISRDIQRVYLLCV